MTKEEFSGWKTSRLTHEIFKYLGKLREYHVDMAAKASFHAETIDKVAMINAHNAGVCSGISEILELEWEDLVDEN